MNTSQLELERAKALQAIESLEATPLLLRSLLAHVVLQPLSTRISCGQRALTLATESRPDYISGNNTIHFPGTEEHAVDAHLFRTYFETSVSIFTARDIPGVHVRSLVQNDREAWMGCTRKAVPSGDPQFLEWLQGEYYDLLHVPGIRGLVAEEEGEIVGSLLVAEIKGATVVDEVLVREDSRGRGICSLLLHRAVAGPVRSDDELAIWVDPQSNLQQALLKKGMRPRLVAYASARSDAGTGPTAIYLNYRNG